MDNWAHYLDTFLFAIVPYVAAFAFVLGAIFRYVVRPYSVSSLSSQFLENRQHFWALVPFHYAIIILLGGHVIGFLVPRHVLAWNNHPVRLYVLEVTALIFGLLALFGLLSAIVRRLANRRVRVVTTFSDWVLLLLLLGQVGAGVYVAVFHPWGSSWFAATAVPYLRSLVTFDPDIRYVVELPFMAKLHVLNAFVLLGVTPFTRLIHMWVAPFPYLWRRPQVVRWYRRRQAAAVPPSAKGADR
ncbi:MAG: respiratory nitrate reductase subunit gamma [bacterium]